MAREILESVGYEDIDALKLFELGSPLAGEIEPAAVFEKSYKPCLTTISQLEDLACKRNDLVLNMVRSSGSLELGEAVLNETKEEVSKGWADGPWPVESLERGATVSRRFPLSQGDKIRMIDDYSVLGVNDSCTIHSKLDLHVVDTFAATAKSYFRAAGDCKKSLAMVAKTYDLKAAYRQVPVHKDRLKQAYFAIFNHVIGSSEIYRSRCLPCGATHSVYSFLRLAKMLHCVACRGAKLITTNFYDDFILASAEDLQDPARNCMELVFLFTGWDFAREGKKATSFAQNCSALGVTFDLRGSCDGTLFIRKSEKRVADLLELITHVKQSKTLNKQDALKLRGNLGFADGFFLHGRIGALVLKRLSQHAYGSSSTIDPELELALDLMAARLNKAKPKFVSATTADEWCVFSDASFETDQKTGALGGVLIDSSCKRRAWFSLKVSKEAAFMYGADHKDTIIYVPALSCLLATLNLGRGAFELFPNFVLRQRQCSFRLNQRNWTRCSCRGDHA